MAASCVGGGWSDAGRGATAVMRNKRSTGWARQNRKTQSCSLRSLRGWLVWGRRGDDSASGMSENSIATLKIAHRRVQRPSEHPRVRRASVDGPRPRPNWSHPVMWCRTRWTNRPARRIARRACIHSEWRRRLV